MFKTELHLHSAEVSDCGRVFSPEIVETYVKAGYDTVVLTNHMSRFTYKSKRNGAREDMTWDEKVDFYLDGYKKLCEAAEGKLNVILGMELRFDTDNNDYLVYGVTEEFMRNTGDLMKMSLKKLKPVFEENGILVFQAHPFRNNMQITNPALLDGVEVFNGHTDHDSRNVIAQIWAEKFGLKRTSGSDYHYSSQTPNAGMLTDVEVKDTAALVEILKNGQYQLIVG